eukprot:COSAG02_NODE_1685_length_11320_cov_4.020408_9_plen_55_part_00
MGRITATCHTSCAVCHTSQGNALSYNGEFVFLVETCREQQREEVDEEVGMLTNH